MEEGGSKAVRAVTAALIAALCTCGCATNTLWAKKAYHPTEHPHLNLAFAPQMQDILVEYDEQCDESSHYQRRAYWLFASTNAVEDMGKPIFVKPGAFTGLMPVPLLDEMPATNLPPVAGYVALPSPAQQGFDLWRDGDPLGRFYLPIYFASPKPTPWRILATPFTALGDTVVAVAVSAAVVAAVVGLLYLESQNN